MNFKDYRNRQNQRPRQETHTGRHQGQHHGLQVKSDPWPVFVSPASKEWILHSLLVGEETRKQKKEYFLTCKNYMKFKFQCI